MHANNVKRSNTENLCQLLQVFVILGLFFWVVSILIIKAHLLHVSITARHQQIMNNQWLFEQCKQPEFYHNMKHHATLCDDLELQSKDSVWLHALRDVLDHSSLCGPVHCDVLFAGAMSYMIDHLPFVAATAVVIFLIIGLFFRPCLSQHAVQPYVMGRDLENDWQRRNFIMNHQYQFD